MVIIITTITTITIIIIIEVDLILELQYFFVLVIHHPQYQLNLHFPPNPSKTCQYINSMDHFTIEFAYLNIILLIHFLCHFRGSQPIKFTIQEIPNFLKYITQI